MKPLEWTIPLAALVAVAGCHKAPAAAVDTWKPEGRVAARARVDRTEALIGEPIHYTIDVSSENGTLAMVPDAPAAIGSFTVAGTDLGLPTRTADGRELRSRETVLETFTTGRHVLPPTKVEWKDAGGQTHEASTSQLVVTVKSVLPAQVAALKLKDVAGPVELAPAPGARWPWVAAIGAAALLSALAVVMYFSRRAGPATRVPSRPPHEVARAELARIRSLGLIAKGAVEEHYVLVSNCVRRYVEDRFGLRAPEMTTEEFLEAIRGSPALERSDRALLETFLCECDLVKFARHVPAATDAEAAIATAEAFVEETAPRRAEPALSRAGPGLEASWDHWEERL